MTDRPRPSRRFGVLLPVTSLPGPGGIGTLGGPATRWLEWLDRAGASVWQFLPLGPPGEGHSPYSSLSSFAGNPLLVAPHDDSEPLPDEAPHTDLADSSEISRNVGVPIDYASVARSTHQTLRAAWHDVSTASADWRGAFERFRHAPSQAGWLDDWTLFAALRNELGERWMEWPEEIRGRDPAALRRARATLADQIEYQAFVQFLFFEQMVALRRRAAELGIELLGDLPFYPALESADVWSHQELFDLTADGRPNNVAGVPPDAFTETGQLWGHPVFRWQEMAAECRTWWIERARAGLRMADRLRLDHFRGYAGYWSVPAGAESAEAGRWCEGPGEALFEAARAAFGGLPFVAEDLGVITDDVRLLLARTGLPGTRVLQFAFEEPDSEHRPDRVTARTMFCTATHDNDTARGWFERLEGEERQRALDCLGGSGETIHWDLLRAAMESPAELAVAPVQDILGLGSQARLNSPGVPTGQWTWRLEELPNPDGTARLRRLIETTGRRRGRLGDRQRGQTPDRQGTIA